MYMLYINQYISNLGGTLPIWHSAFFMMSIMEERECLKIGAPERFFFELKNTDLGRPYRHPYFETSP